MFGFIERGDGKGGDEKVGEAITVENLTRFSNDICFNNEEVTSNPRFLGTELQGSQVSGSSACQAFLALL